MGKYGNGFLGFVRLHIKNVHIYSKSDNGYAKNTLLGVKISLLVVFFITKGIKILIEKHRFYVVQLI